MTNLEQYENKREQIKLYEQIEDLIETLRRQSAMEFREEQKDKFEVRLINAKNDLMEIAFDMYPSTVTRDEYEEAVRDGIFCVECANNSYRRCAKHTKHKGEYVAMESTRADVERVR